MEEKEGDPEILSSVMVQLLLRVLVRLATKGLDTLKHGRRDGRERSELCLLVVGVCNNDNELGKRSNVLFCIHCFEEVDWGMCVRDRADFVLEYSIEAARLFLFVLIFLKEDGSSTFGVDVEIVKGVFFRCYVTVVHGGFCITTNG